MAQSGRVWTLTSRMQPLDVALSFPTLQMTRTCLLSQASVLRNMTNTWIRRDWTQQCWQSKAEPAANVKAQRICTFDYVILLFRKSPIVWMTEFKSNSVMYSSFSSPWPATPPPYPLPPPVFSLFLLHSGGRLPYLVRLSYLCPQHSESCHTSAWLMRDQSWLHEPFT